MTRDLARFLMNCRSKGVPFCCWIAVCRFSLQYQKWHVRLLQFEQRLLVSSIAKQWTLGKYGEIISFRLQNSVLRSTLPDSVLSRDLTSPMSSLELGERQRKRSPATGCLTSARKMRLRSSSTEAEQSTPILINYYQTIMILVLLGPALSLNFTLYSHSFLPLSHQLLDLYLRNNPALPALVLFDSSPSLTSAIDIINRAIQRRPYSALTFVTQCQYFIQSCNFTQKVLFVSPDRKNYLWNGVDIFFQAKKELVQLDSVQQILQMLQEHDLYVGRWGLNKAQIHRQIRGNLLNKILIDQTRLNEQQTELFRRMANYFFPFIRLVFYSDSQSIAEFCPNSSLARFWLFKPNESARFLCQPVQSDGLEKAILENLHYRNYYSPVFDNVDETPLHFKNRSQINALARKEERPLVLLVSHSTPNLSSLFKIRQKFGNLFVYGYYNCFCQKFRNVTVPQTFIVESDLLNVLVWPQQTSLLRQYTQTYSFNVSTKNDFESCLSAGSNTQQLVAFFDSKDPQFLTTINLFIRDSAVRFLVKFCDSTDLHPSSKQQFNVTANTMTFLHLDYDKAGQLQYLSDSHSLNRSVEELKALLNKQISAQQSFAAKLFNPQQVIQLHHDSDLSSMCSHRVCLLFTGDFQKSAKLLHALQKNLLQKYRIYRVDKKCAKGLQHEFTVYMHSYGKVRHYKGEVGVRPMLQWLWNLQISPANFNKPNEPIRVLCSDDQL